MSEPGLVEPLRRWDPEQLGGYVLIGRLGAGAMGRVYLGRSAAGRLVAVKTIRIELADEPDFRTRFAQEVAAARRVSGAFTAAVVAADPEADLPWLATAYVPAPSLSMLGRTCGPLPSPAVRWLAAGCAEALESIHSAGLVHRDLKPSNVLVSLDGPRVIDFGVARAAERIQLTVTHGAVGTPAYMAPEQARDTRHATIASDVFSLGATMVFAATGHAPYQGETVMDVLVRLATEPPDLSGLPADLTDIVAACLHRDPRQRPTSGSILAQLAPGIAAAAGDREFGTASLPGSALALIAAYRRDPRPSAEANAESGDDITFGSQPGRSGPPESESRRTAAHRRVTSRRPAGREQAGREHAGRARTGGGAWQRQPRGRRVLIAFAAVVAAVALMTSGAILGASIVGRRPLPPPPRTTGPGQLLVPDGKPQIIVNPPAGDALTGFVVHGVGWAPGGTVTVALIGVGVSSVHPPVDSRGTFNYTIDQNHEFLPGALPLAVYQVLVTGAGGARASAHFTVNHR